MKKKRLRKDEMREEYDFRSMRVVARGPGRKPAGDVVVPLAPDVAEAFPNAEAVNEALRLLLRVAKNQLTHSR
jgi:hypothetical protein